MPVIPFIPLIAAVLAPVAAKALGPDSPSSAAPAASAPLPTTPQATQMALPDDAAAEAAKRRSLAQQVARRGRASSVLSAPDQAQQEETFG